MNTDNEKIFTKSFFLIFIALLFTALVMYALMSTVTEHATAMGSSATVAGLVSGIYIFGGLLSRIYSGNALGKHSWRKIALVFMSIHFISCFLYFFVSDVSLLIIVRFIHGIGFGASANAIVTIASEILPKSRFGEAFGYFMLGTTIAVGLGPYIGAFLYDNFSASGCFLSAMLFSAIALAAMSLIDIDKFDTKKADECETSYSLFEKVFEIKAIPVSLFTALTALGYVSILSFYRLYAAQVNLVDAFSYFFIIYSICLVASRPIAGKIQDKYGDMIICVVGILAQSIGIFLIAWAPSHITVFICAVCVALGFGTLNSACTTIVTRNSPIFRRSYALSTFFIFCDATMGFGPALLGSFVSPAAGYTMMYYVASAVTFLALPIAILSLRKN